MKKYKVDDIVVYGTHGVCKIAEETINTVNRQERSYYVLKPLNDAKSTIFVPMDSEKLVAKFRHLLSLEEIHSLIDELPSEETPWIKNERARKEHYRQILNDSSLSDMIGMIRTLHAKRAEREKLGKGLHIIDESFMKKAEKMLYDELSYVLKIDQREVLPFIFERMNQSNNESEQLEA